MASYDVASNIVPIARHIIGHRYRTNAFEPAFRDLSVTP
jgi:hypothetical protein